MSALPFDPYAGMGPSWLPGADFRTPPFNPQAGPYGMPPGGAVAPPQAPQQQGWQGALRGFLGNRDLAMALLANSGYSPNKRGFGEILGTSMMQVEGMQRQRAEDDIMRRYREAQIAHLGAPGAESSPYGKYQPGDYTPQSWAKFVKSNDPNDLERYTTPRQEFSPSFQNVTRTNPDGSTQQGTFNTRSGEYNWVGATVPAGTKARTDAQASAEGEAAGGQTAKTPAKSSMDYVIGQFREQIKATPQGGLFGYKGKAGAVTDKQARERFDNLREQLSTEMRTVYRIPGEGTLSDQEQKQYGIQLPSVEYEAETNTQILNDIEARTGLRLNTPIGSPAAPAAGGSAPAPRKRRYNPATGKIE